MAKLRLNITWGKTAIRAEFVDLINIDRSELARVLTRMMRKKGAITAEQRVDRSVISHWIKKRRIPDVYIPFIQKINLSQVLTFRKPTQKKRR